MNGCPEPPSLCRECGIQGLFLPICEFAQASSKGSFPAGEPLASIGDRLIEAWNLKGIPFESRPALERDRSKPAGAAPFFLGRRLRKAPPLVDVAGSALFFDRDPKVWNRPPPKERHSRVDIERCLRHHRRGSFQPIFDHRSMFGDPIRFSLGHRLSRSRPDICECGIRFFPFAPSVLRGASARQGA